LHDRPARTIAQLAQSPSSHDRLARAIT